MHKRPGRDHWPRRSTITDNNLMSFQSFSSSTPPPTKGATPTTASLFPQRNSGNPTEASAREICNELEDEKNRRWVLRNPRSDRRFGAAPDAAGAGNRPAIQARTSTRASTDESCPRENHAENPR